jgi:glycosyltransferase involved in cell wall biosynthesis
VSRLRVGWLAQQNAVLPRDAAPASVAEVTWQLVSRLKDRCDFLLATSPHPDLGAASQCLDGIEYVRADLAGDLRRGRSIDRLNRIQRALHLRDLPYAGRSSYFRDYARQHAAALRKWNPDIVHVDNTTQWIAILRRQLPTTPLVLHMHSEWLTDIPYEAGLERIQQADRILAVSDHVARLVRDRYPRFAERVLVQPNGFDPSRFPGRERINARHRSELEDLKKRLGLANQPIVLFVGRISAEKGLHYLLEALPAIRARVPDVRVVLAGGPYSLLSPLPTRRRPELQGRRDWRARYGASLARLAEPFEDTVVFAGAVRPHEIPLAYALADVYVQPSVIEAYGLPVIEAMASGLPVVATTAGGMPEQVADGETGLLVPPGDPRSLAEAISRVLLDRTLARRLAATATEHARRNLTWDSAAERLLAVYESLTAGDVQEPRSRADSLRSRKA